jgi:hypothetical protein
MVDTAGDTPGIERRQLAAHRDPLFDLPHFGQLEAGPQLGLTDEDDLKKLFPAFQFREDADPIPSIRCVTLGIRSGERSADYGTVRRFQK